MSERHSKRGIKWQELKRGANLQSLVRMCQSRLSENRQSHITSIAAYYLLTELVWVIFYSSSTLERLLSWLSSESIINPVSNNEYGTVYFLVCSIVPIICMLPLTYCNASHIAKLLSVVYLLLVINNVAMALDYYRNSEVWYLLDRIDTVINGSSDAVFAFGVVDWILVPIGALCIILSWRRLD